MDKFAIKLPVAFVLTVLSGMAYGGFYVGGISRDVLANRQEISEMKREWVESRKEMVALRLELAQLNGLLSRKGINGAEK